MKKIFYISVLLCMVFWLKIPSQAAEKELSVDIPHDAGIATFFLDFVTDQEYMVTITLPDGESISQPIASLSGQITILDPATGTYTILITAEEDISVNARVELKNSRSSTLAESGITISSSFTDLSLYFIDGSIAGDWKDTNLGKINIVITNPVTMQVLHNVTVEGNSFLLSIPDNVQEIEVYIVPASNAKIAGAGVTYTLPVIRNLDAEISLPQENLTNKDFIIVDAKFGSDFAVEVIENKITVYAEELSAGDHEIEIPLNSISNQIIIYVRDSKKNTSSYLFNIQKDVIAPTLKLSEAYGGTTEKEEITLSGVVTEADFLYVNGIEVEIPTNGKFTVSCGLDIGINEISVCAMDIAGNENLIKVTIERLQPSALSKIMLYIVPALAVLVGILLYRRTRKRMLQDASNDGGTKTHAEKKLKYNEKKCTSVRIPHEEVNKRIKKKRRLIMLSTLGNTAIAVAGIYILIHSCFLGTYVASGSMEPTLMTGDIVIYNKLYFLSHAIARGDIICTWSDTYDSYIAKRVIGLPGDAIEFHDGNVFINGKICREAYLQENVETNSLKSFNVPEGKIFIMGDNRENSVDSRYWDEPYIDMDNIAGKYFGTIPNPFAR